MSRLCAWGKLKLLGMFDGCEDRVLAAPYLAKAEHTAVKDSTDVPAKARKGERGF